MPTRCEPTDAAEEQCHRVGMNNLLWKDMLSMKTQDHYCTLGVERNASDAEIKLAYRKLAHRFHPDVSSDADGERKFKNVSEAYKTLYRTESRTAYDHQGIPEQDDSALVWNVGVLDIWCSVNPWRCWLWFCQNKRGADAER